MAVQINRFQPKPIVSNSGDSVGLSVQAGSDQAHTNCRLRCINTNGNQITLSPNNGNPNEHHSSPFNLTIGLNNINDQITFTGNGQINMSVDIIDENNNPISSSRIIIANVL